MNSTQKVVMAVVAMVAVASVVVAVFFFIHKITPISPPCPACVQSIPTETVALKVMSSGQFLKADGTLTSNALEATNFTVFKCTGAVYPAIETMNWTLNTVENVSVLSTIDKQLGSIIMDVSKSPVGAKPQSVMAGLHDTDCQLAIVHVTASIDLTPHATGLLPVTN